MGKVDSFLGGKPDLWLQFSPLANTKYDSAAADQSSRQADTRLELAVYSPVFSASRYQTAVVQSWRNSQAHQPAWGEATEMSSCWGASRAVLRWVSLNGNITSRAQQCYVSWTNTCILLAKNSKAKQIKPRLNATVPLSVGSYLYSFITHPFTHVCFTKALFQVLL